MHSIRAGGRIALAIFAVAAMLGATSLHAKQYKIFFKDSAGSAVRGAGTFEWEPGVDTVDFPAALELFGTRFEFLFDDANVISEDDHASCVKPDAAPEDKICPSRVRAVLGSAPPTNPPPGFPTDIELVLSDNGNLNDRVGIWSFGNTGGITFITNANGVPAPPAALLLLAGLPGLILVRRRLRR